MKKVIVIATSRDTRGGITSVVLAHEQGRQWHEYHCKWIASHSDKNVIAKLLTLILGWLKFMFYLPFAEIVHVHLSEPPSAIRKCLFVVPTLLFRKKLVTHFHSFSPNTTISSKYSCVYRFIFGHSNIVIVLSQYWKDAVNEEFYQGEKVRIVYNPCSKVPTTTLQGRENTILYAGAVNQRKGYADLIKAFSMVADKHQDWKLVIAGNGEIEKGEELTQQLGIKGQCDFLGWVSGNEKDKAFRDASIFCLPSYAEGFPMGVLDAMAYGLPVITTPVGGIPDMMRGDEGHLYEPGGGAFGVQPLGQSFRQSRRSLDL